MATKIEIGLEENQRKQVAAGLSGILADTFVLYNKTLGYHWNVTGPMFHSLHDMFEGQYEDLGEALDDLAERIRSVGEVAPTGPSAYLKLSSLEEDTTTPEAMQMVTNLLTDNEAVIRNLREVIKTAQDVGDEGTADMLTARMEKHEETAWMLRATAQ